MISFNANSNQIVDLDITQIGHTNRSFRHLHINNILNKIFLPIRPKDSTDSSRKSMFVFFFNNYIFINLTNLFIQKILYTLISRGIYVDILTIWTSSEFCMFSRLVIDPFNIIYDKNNVICL